MAVMLCKIMKQTCRLFYTSFIYNVISKFRSVGSTFSSVGPHHTDALRNPSNYT